MRYTIKAVCGGLAWLLAQATAAEPATAAAVSADSATALVEQRVVPQRWVAEASVEAVNQATLSVQIAGRILEVKAEPGQRVKAGQVLMRIDAREASAGVAAAEARLAQAEAQNARNQRLLERHFVSPAAVDLSNAELKAARADATAARAGLSHGVLTAPMDGIVGQRLAEAGDLATPGKPLLTLFDPARLRLVAAVPQAYLARIAAARKARIEFPEQNRTLDAVRVEVLPTVDPATRNGTVRVYLAEREAGVLPGMYGRVQLVVGEAQKLMVPAAAVLRRGEATLVYVVDAKGGAHLRQVRPGETSVDGVEILAGVTAGERVSLIPLQIGLAPARRTP